MYNCSFGLNRNFQDLLHKNGFKVIGIDENEEARLMMVERNSFFIVSLFQPQLSSTYEQPHPLVTEFLKQSRQFSMGI
jgi:CTP synthase (UTP-ammonia lyase)